MHIVLLQTDVKQEEVDKLLQEFPNYLFLALNKKTYQNLTVYDWMKVEVIFGHYLTEEELALAPNLKWIHSPNPYLERLCLEGIQNRGNILITTTPEENDEQVAEFVMGGVLAYAKQFFRWSDANRFPALLWESKWRKSMWTLRDRLFVQIGLGSLGTEVARRAKDWGMKVWGVQQDRTFHPYCQKTIAQKDLHSILPRADVVSVCLPRKPKCKDWFRLEELELMKPDSVLVTIGLTQLYKKERFAEVARARKLRGIVADVSYDDPIAPNGDLWQVPHLLLTPEVASYPLSEKRQSFRLFRYNFRQYIHGNLQDMRHNMKQPSLR